MCFLRLQPPSVPNVNIFSEVVLDAFAMAIVGYAISISLGKTFALKHGYKVESNQVCKSPRHHAYCMNTRKLYYTANVCLSHAVLQELVALGLSNTIGGFFQCFSVCSSMSRSLIQESTGGKTQARLTYFYKYGMLPFIHHIVLL